MSSNLRRVLHAFFVVAIALTALPFSSTPAASALSCIATPTVDAVVRLAQDGTPAWTSPDPTFAGGVDPGAGNDSGPENNIAVANDLLTYHGEINLIRCDSDNTRLTFTLSNALAGVHVVWYELPGECLTTGVAPTSSISADGQTLVCNIGFKQQGTVAIVEPKAIVRATASHGEALSLSLDATADGANTATRTAADVRVSAKASFDLVKSLIEVVDAPGPLGEAGKRFTYGLALIGGKGSEALDGAPIVVNDSFSSDVGPNHALLYDWDSTLSSCNINGVGGYTVPEMPFGVPGLVDVTFPGVTGFPVVASSTTANATANSGTWACAQTTAAGTDMGTGAHTFTISMSGHDGSLSSSPTVRADGIALTPTEHYVLAGYVNIWLPFTDLDAPPSGNKSTIVRNDYAALVASGISGQAATEPTLTNNTAIRGFSYSNSASVPGAGGFVASGNLIQFDHPATGTQTVAPNQIVHAGFGIGYYGTDWHRAQHLSCVAWDPTKLSLEPYDNQPADYVTAAVQSWATSGWVPTRELTQAGANPSLIPQFLREQNTWNFPIYSWPPVSGHQTIGFSDQFTVEVTATPAVDYVHPQCGTYGDTVTSGPWCAFADIGTPACPSIPNTQAVQRVRSTMLNIEALVAPWEVASSAYSNSISEGVYGTLPLRVAASATPGERIGVFHSVSYNDGTSWIVTPASTSPADIAYAYAPSNGCSGCMIGIGSSDRFTVAAARTSITKVTTDLPADAQSVYLAGATAGFRLDPSITVPSPQPTPTSVTITDTLPAGLSYNNDAAFMASPNCTTAGPDTCAQAAIDAAACALDAGYPQAGVDPGTTVVQWTCANVALDGAPGRIPSITYTTTIDPSFVRADFPNRVEISSPADPAIVGGATDPNSPTGALYTAEAATKFVNDHTHVRTISTFAPGAYSILKQLATPLVERNEPIGYLLQYTNTSGGMYKGEQFIDVLPYLGNTSQGAPSDFSGTVALRDISGANGETFAFTAAPHDSISLDPCDVSNVALGLTSTPSCATLFGGTEGTGATVWCPVAKAGTEYADSDFASLPADCPHSLAEVHGILADGPLLPVGAPTRSMTLWLQPNGNREGDVYTNEFSSRLQDQNLVLLSVVSNEVSARVITGSLSGTVINRGLCSSIADGVANAELSVVGDPGQPAGSYGVGVDPMLLDPGADGLFGTADDAPLIVTTDADGTYTTPALHSGVYTVTLRNAPTKPVSDPDGSSSADTYVVDLAADTDLGQLDFVYDGVKEPCLSLGDRVWFDANHDGVQGPDEAGVPNVLVELLDEFGEPARDADGNVVLAVTTDANGRYPFTNLLPGNYRVRFTLPDGYEWTVSAEGGDRSLDADPEITSPTAATVTTGVIRLGAAVTDTQGNPLALTNPTIDAGLWRRPLQIVLAFTGRDSRSNAAFAWTMVTVGVILLFAGTRSGRATRRSR